jgi:aminopeptidase N
VRGGGRDRSFAASARFADISRFSCPLLYKHDMSLRIFLLLMAFSTAAFSQASPPIEPGVSQELAKWRAGHYSDVRYKLNLTLEKMSPVLKGTMEIRVNVSVPPVVTGGSAAQDQSVPIILDWRKIKGHEDKSTVANIRVNGKPIDPPVTTGGTDTEHLIFREGVVAGENVIKLDFTSPILPSGSAITRYVDKEDGSEYIYSLFVPSDASTAFPVFDQPDLKARFELGLTLPDSWEAVSNSEARAYSILDYVDIPGVKQPERSKKLNFLETKPISTYVFAFAAGSFERVENTGGNLSGSEGVSSPPVKNTLPTGRVSALGANRSKNEVQPPATAGGTDIGGAVYVRKSQVVKFKPHAAEVFRLNREAVKYFEEYFDYKFPFPKYDLVLIPEFPFGGMEHAGATFLREASVIFPQEPTKNDHINRATLIFHEAAHQWFGDTVTMRWFDDLWLKEGFATFTAYKALEKIMPEMNAWKVFYERIKQGAYATDSTKGTTPIYQEIKNLSAAKSAYGNIVYNKAPAFLRQAEFYLGEDKFQTAVKAFLKKHEFGNAGWEDLVREFEEAHGNDLEWWAEKWVTEPRLPVVRSSVGSAVDGCFTLNFRESLDGKDIVDGWRMGVRTLIRFPKTSRTVDHVLWGISGFANCERATPQLLFPNYGDYGYGIFLLDEKSRDYVLKNIQNEKDPFLRSMMWGALWDSVREGELDPREYVELVVKNLEQGRTSVRAVGAPEIPELDESTTSLLLSRVSVAMNYYIPAPRTALTDVLASASGGDLQTRVEAMLIAGMRNSPTLGQRITDYRAFSNVASTERARGVLKDILNLKFEIKDLKLKTKDKFDIITKLLILGDAEAPALLAGLEKTETSDEAKRYAYAARAGIGTAENKAKFWKDFTENKEISESWIEAAFGPWNSIRHSDLTLPYLERALRELPNHKRNRKIFFVNGWLGAFIGGQRSEEALAIINKFLADNPNLDRDLRLKILENVDVIERAAKIRKGFPQSRKGA